MHGLASVLALLMAFSTLRSSAQVPPSELGVVIEQVQKGSESEKAGLQPGDVVLAWSRADSRGHIESPFDLAEIEMEQSPQGTILLEGLRGREKQVWRMGPNAWGIVRRPTLSGKFLTAYLQSQELAKTGALAEAAESLRTVASLAQKSDPSWLGPWFLSRAGEWRGQARQSKEADEAYGEAIRASSNPKVTAQLLLTWGDLFNTRSEWAQAEDRYSRSITESRKLATISLTIAGIINKLGHVAFQRGDPTKAEEYYRQALVIREQLAPGSIDVARSLNNLGIVARDRGDLAKAEEYHRQSLATRERLAPGSMDVAGSLQNLGIVARDRGNLAKAEEYFRQSLATRERLAPGSMDVAGSLQNLGILARDRGNLAKAEEYFRQSLAIREKLAPGSLDVADGLYNLGKLALDRGDLAEAEKYFRKGLAVSQILAPSGPVVARALNSLGIVIVKQGDTEKAEEYFQQALTIREKLAPGSLDVAESLNNLGNAAWYRRDLPKADEYYRGALVIQEEMAAGTLAIAGTLHNLGNIAWDRGDLAKAEDYHRQALATREKVAPGSLDVAQSFNSLGTVASDRGDLAKAEEYHRQALAIREQLASGSMDVAETLNSLSVVAKVRGDLATAEEYLRRALAIQEGVAPGSLDVAGSLSNLSSVAIDRGDLGKAEMYVRRALATQEKRVPGSLDVATSLDNLGEIVRKRGSVDKAEEYFHRALTIQEEVAPDGLDVADSLHNLGDVAKDRGSLNKAEAYFRRALAIRERLAPAGLSEAQALYDLGSTLLLQGQADQAIAIFERSVNALESQTRRLGGTEALRSAFRSQYSGYYRDYIGALLAKKEPERAFHVLERSRARSLLSLIAERDLVFAVDLPRDIQRERKLNAAVYDRIQGEIAKLNPKKDAAHIDQSLARLRELAAEREEIAERVKRISPRYAALQYPQPLDLEGARRTLDAGTIMLSYSVGSQQTDLFVVQPNGSPTLSVYTLPVGEMALRKHIKEFRSLIEEVPHIHLDRVRLAANRVALNQRARALYDLLVKPAETQIATSQRLLIAPDGPLHTLPFSALIRNEKQYLVEWKPLHTIVSATLYAEMKRARVERRSPPLQLVAFGSPLYPKLDQNSSSNRSADVEVALSVERGLDLTPLPFTKDEVNDIAKLFPNRRQVNLGADATEERAKSASPRARYIHFAVHGFLDELFPLNSGLALTIPEKAAGRDNGLLQAWEIFAQVRLEADLVVLSACQTGLGKEQNGEGLIGLTRAFQHAGARTILASLWNVDDLATAGLMKTVYAQLRKGKSKDQSLRTAQLEMLRFRRSSHPYYWAAFTLIGDWQ